MRYLRWGGKGEPAALVNNKFIDRMNSVMIELADVHGAWPYLGSNGLREMTNMSHISCRCCGVGCQPPALIVSRAAAAGAVV